MQGMKESRFHPNSLLPAELFAFGAAGNLAEVKPDTGLILKRKPITFSKFVQDHLRLFMS